jgi:hypothetical protein
LICSEELGSRHQTPTLIGCIFLTNLQDLRAFQPFLLAVFTAISEALDVSTLFSLLSSLSLLFFAFLLCVLPW